MNDSFLSPGHHMNADTQKIWTLRLTPADAPATTIEGIPQEQMVKLLHQAIHGYGSFEQLLAGTAHAGTARAGDHEQPLAA